MSFLEKLQKSMRAGQNEPGGHINNAELPQNEPTQENNAATFAAFRSAEPESSEDSDPQTKKGGKPRGRTRKIITADNIDEATSLSSEDVPEDENSQFKKSTSKNMANKKTLNTETKEEKEWLNNEGQLAVNVYQTETDLVLQAAIAGIKVDDLDVLIEDDVITIKGNRPNPLEETGDYFIEECYWGTFARKVILPVEVDSTRADAAMKDGVLTIRIPKIQREKKKKLTIKE